ncbi:MAG: cupin domain-containing protein [Coprococcus sp.]
MDNFKNGMDRGPWPYTADIRKTAMKNQNFRAAVWTGCHLQMTLMCIPVCGEIGLEIHPDTDQVIRVEKGRAVVRMGNSRQVQNYQQQLCEGDAVFVPAGTWHNILNMGREPLKLSSIYAPPHHKRGTIHRTKAEAEMDEQCYN